MILLEDILRQRHLPPRLATSGTSSRTALTEPRNGRMYPPPERVEAWEDFHDGVLSFTCNGNIPLRDSFGNFFKLRIIHVIRRMMRKRT